MSTGAAPAATSSPDPVYILGAGMHPWGKWGRDFTEYGVVAARAALAEAVEAWRHIQLVAGASPLPDGPPGAAGADQQHALALGLDAGRPRRRQQAHAVEHLARHPPVGVEAHRVDRPHVPAVGPQLVTEPGDRLLVGDGHDEATQVADPGEPPDHVGEVLGRDVQRHEQGVDVLSLENRVEELRCSHMRDRMGDDRIEPGLAGQ
jgi:hypothetical protein